VFLSLIWSYLILITAVCLWGVIIMLGGDLKASLTTGEGSWLIANHLGAAQTAFITTTLVILTLAVVFFLQISQLVFSHFLNFLAAQTTP